MNLKHYVTSKQNIYLAIYSIKSYVYCENLLESNDMDLYQKLLDPFNEIIIDNVIEDVRKIIENIIDDNTFFFMYKYILYLNHMIQTNSYN